MNRNINPELWALPTDAEVLAELVNMPNVSEGHLIGHRGWTFKNGRLHGAHGGEWTPNLPKVAIDATHIEGHPPGIYAAKTAQEDHRYDVYGTVALWGLVIEHERGYRARFGYPISLTLYAEKDESQAISDLYNVPCNYVFKEKKNELDEDLRLYRDCLLRQHQQVYRSSPALDWTFHQPQTPKKSWWQML